MLYFLWWREKSWKEGREEARKEVWMNELTFDGWMKVMKILKKEGLI